MSVQQNSLLTSSLGRKKGFTLIELMVAISIVAILATVGIIQYSAAQSIARDSKIKQDVEEIKKAVYIYRASAGNFCLGVNSCSYSIWVNYGGYSAPYDAAVNNLKDNLTQKTMYDPYIGLRIENANEFYIFTSLSKPPASSCSKLDMWDDWSFTGTSYPMNYCISSD